MKPKHVILSLLSFGFAYSGQALTHTDTLRYRFSLSLQGGYYFDNRKPNHDWVLNRKDESRKIEGSFGFTVFKNTQVVMALSQRSFRLERELLLESGTIKSSAIGMEYRHPMGKRFHVLFGTYLGMGFLESKRIIVSDVLTIPNYVIKSFGHTYFFKTRAFTELDLDKRRHHRLGIGLQLFHWEEQRGQISQANATTKEFSSSGWELYDPLLLIRYRWFFGKEGRLK